MNRLLLISLASCFATGIASSQINPPGITATSLKYHEFRMRETSPSFGLAKIQALVSKLKKKDVPESDQSTAALPNKGYDSLSTREKFTYCMVHGENFGQN